jgi:signal transduction histidine kinase
LLIVGITGIAWTGSEIWSTFAPIGFKQIISFEPPYGIGEYNPWVIAIYCLGIYLAGSAFVILFSSVVISEQKSRQKAEELAQQVETLAATLERTRIARDIHDSLGHTLTNLDIQLEVAQKLRDRNPDKAFQAVDTAKMLSSQCIEDVSRALKTMRQSDFDLNQALSTLIENFRQHQSGRVHSEINLPSLPLQTSHQIYCIVKEGLTNIQKHAKANFVCFLARGSAESIILKLEDNGVGFDDKSTQTGFGLQGIAERVQILGGGLEIDSTLGQGTRIQVTLLL